MKKHYKNIFQQSCPLLILLITLCLNTKPVAAQDAHYWTQAYSPAGFIAPGAVIVNNRDSGVYYYNPALLALSTKNTVSVTANLYQLSYINLKDGVGNGSNLRNRHGSNSPMMVAGTITLKKDRPLVVGYSIQRHTQMSFGVNQRMDDVRNVLDESYSPGNEAFIGQISNHNNINETLGQVSLGTKLSNSFAIGLTLEGVLRNQNFLKNFSAKALINGTENGAALGPYSGSSEYYELNVLTAGARAKLGASYDVDRHHIGLLLTSPLLGLRGKSTIVADATITNLHLVEGLPAYNVIASDRQSGLKSRYKTPFSAALGYAYDYNKGQISITAEYFGSVGEYDMISLRPLSFIRGEGPDEENNSTENLRFKDRRNSVFNVGVGSSYQMSEKLTTYLAFRTDFTYFKPNHEEEFTGYYTNTSLWNNYHLQLGANIKRRKFNLRTGLLLSYGATKEYEQEVNFNTVLDQNAFIGNPQLIKANYFSVGLMLAYIHNL